MKRILITLTVVAFLMTWLALVVTASAENVCPECELYEYEAILPYIIPSETGWWTGIAVTNTGDVDVILRLDYLGDNSVQRVAVLAKGITTFVPDIEATSYARVRSIAPLYVTVMISNGQMMQGYNVQLAKSVTPDELGD